MPLLESSFLDPMLAFQGYRNSICQGCRLSLVPVDSLDVVLNGLKWPTTNRMSVESLEGGLMVKQAVKPPSPFAPPLPPRHSPPSLLLAPKGRQGAPPAGRHARYLGRSSPKKGRLLGAGRRGLLGSIPEDDALLRRKTRRNSDRRGVALRVANIPPELDTVHALEDLFAGYNLRSARPTEALVTLASMADAEAAAAFLEHMSFSTGQIKVT
ncbi:unnamed protein product, partial [Cyprideis torosa]